MKYYENMNDLEAEFVREHQNTINPCLRSGEQGDPEAWFMLGSLYWYEAPSDRFKEEGIRLLELAAEKGNLEAAQLLISIPKNFLCEFNELEGRSDSHDSMMYEHTNTKETYCYVSEKYYDPEDTTELFYFQANEESLLFLIVSMFGIIPAVLYGIHAFTEGLGFNQYLVSLFAFGLGLVFFFLRQRRYLIRFHENGISISRKTKNPVFIPRENLLGIRLFGRSLDLVHTDGLLEYQVENSLLKANARSFRENFDTYMSVFPSQYYYGLPELELKRQVIHHSYKHVNYNKLVELLDALLVTGEEILFVSQYRNYKSIILIMLGYMVVSSFIAKGLLIALPFLWLLSYRANLYLIITSKGLKIFKNNFETTLKYTFVDLKNVTMRRSGIRLESENWVETINIRLGKRDILNVLAYRLKDIDKVKVVT